MLPPLQKYFTAPSHSRYIWPHQASESRVMLVAKTNSNGEPLKIRRTQFPALPQNPGLIPQFGGVFCSAGNGPRQGTSGSVEHRDSQSWPCCVGSQAWGCKGYRTPVVVQRAELLYPGKNVACSSTAINTGDRWSSHRVWDPFLTAPCRHFSFLFLSPHLYFCRVEC